MAAHDGSPSMYGAATGPAFSRKSSLFGISQRAAVAFFRCPAGCGAIPKGPPVQSSVVSHAKLYSGFGRGHGSIGPCQRNAVQG
jgi:hypothetical protein